MQIVLFLLFIVLVLLLFTIKNDELSIKAKIGIIAILAILIMLASWFELSQDNEAEITREKVNAFVQGKTLECEGIRVSKEEFDYVSGTQTFVPLRSNTKSKGLILEAQKCKVIK